MREQERQADDPEPLAGFFQERARLLDRHRAHGRRVVRGAAVEHRRDEARRDDVRLVQRTGGERCFRYRREPLRRHLLEAERHLLPELSADAQDEDAADADLLQRLRETGVDRLHAVTGPGFCDGEAVLAQLGRGDGADRVHRRDIEPAIVGHDERRRAIGSGRLTRERRRDDEHRRGADCEQTEHATLPTRQYTKSKPRASADGRRNARVGASFRAAVRLTAGARREVLVSGARRDRGRSCR